MLLKREQIPAELKWDLTTIYKNQEEFEKDFSTCSKKLSEIAVYKGKLNETNLIECLNLNIAIERTLEKLYIYSHLLKDENAKDNKAQSMSEKTAFMMVEYSTLSSFIIPEISKFKVSVLSKMQTSEIYSDYDILLKNIIKDKKHILSEKEEKILAEISSFTRDFKSIFSMFDNADITFDSIKDDKGETVEMSHGIFSKMLQNPEQKVRREAFLSNYKSYRSMINTLAAIYSGNVKKNTVTAKLRKYKSALARALDAEEVNPVVYNNLLKSVRKHQKYVHNYVAFRKKALKLKELHMYDLYVPITKDYEMSLDFNESFDLVLKALAPLGENYSVLLNKAKTERWIDVMETPNKRSGAYSWGCFDTNPFVLLNHQNTTHDTFTVAHELGHSLHSYLSNKNQPYQKASYEIFVAEVASTVNEVLLLKYLIKNKPDGKKFFLSYYLDMFRTTVFRQTMFSEFEKFAHEQIEKGEPLTSENLSEKYLELNKEYYGKAVIHDDDIRYEWARIPHFYNAFYVYKYSTGLISAVNIANNILDKGKPFADKYLKFLSSGGSDKPTELLKIVDIDLESNIPFDNAMEEFKETLNELRKTYEK